MKESPTKHRIYTTSFASVYPMYIAKAERKGRTKKEVDEIICWLTGYTQKGLETEIQKLTDFETFFREAPKLNPARTLISGVICGVRIEDIKEDTMREIRYLDKLIDELINTGDAWIVEDVTARGDVGGNLFWGAMLVDGKWVGKNTLGQLWMDLRKDYKNLDL